ncbi:MAG: MCE family protein [Nocardioides sp.]|nr:MCE family protein [Nocardioides sp.]
MSRTTLVQLIAFAVVASVAVVYGAFAFFDAGDLVAPPYRVTAQFAGSGGIYPRASVELLGTEVGKVTELRPGPGTGTTVVMQLDPEAKVPRAVTARIGMKSVIGEQYVELTPTRAGGPYLHAGSVIPTAATQTPVDTATVLEHVSQLVSSIDPKDLSTVLDELSTGVGTTAPATERALDDADRLSKVSLDDVNQIDDLIDNARTVLGTQADLAPTTGTMLQQIAGLLAQLQRLEPQLGDVLTQGIRAGTEMNGLLSANASAIALLLDDTLHLTDMIDARRPALRKAMVLLPWVQESVSAVVRSCDDIDPTTAKPVAKSCHYDQDGRPLYAAYVGMQLPQSPGGSQTYFPCSQGYEKTKHHLPNGQPIGGGPVEQEDADPNLDAHCTASPTDPVAPNVRGAQNVDIPPTSPRTPPQQVALYDPNTDTVATPDGAVHMDTSAPPTAGGDRLGWLLTGALRGDR